MTVYIEVILKEVLNAGRGPYGSEAWGALVHFKQRYQVDLCISVFSTHPDCHLQVPIMDAGNQYPDDLGDTMGALRVIQYLIMLFMVWGLCCIWLHFNLWWEKKVLIMCFIKWFPNPAQSKNHFNIFILKKQSLKTTSPVSSESQWIRISWGLGPGIFSF